jgi:cyclopropane fatty-acyl-phospholipid synthase-like methyltransferase
MSTAPDQSRFRDMYTTQAPAPWDIGRPQSAIAAAADRVKSPLLDSGCGTGDTALFFAAKKHKVTGIDFLEEPLRRAKQKATERKLAAQFLQKDALTLDQWDHRFNTIIDSGLFHVFDDANRRRYVNGLAHILNPAGHLLLLCFSDAEPPGNGPRRISRDELDEAFSKGWHIESIEPTRFEINPQSADLGFSPGGPKAWFSIIRRGG